MKIDSFKTQGLNTLILQVFEEHIVVLFVVVLKILGLQECDYVYKG